MFNKEWVQLNRATNEYMKGAADFLKVVKNFKVDVEKIMCPCKECRNMSHQTFDMVYEHLVINGMDPTYKVWYHHGEQVYKTGRIEDIDKFDAFDMYKSAYLSEEENINPCNLSINDDLNEKVQEAESPLYPGCTKFSKMSAIVVLYKLKTTSGWSDKSFNGLLQILHDMLPEDNVIPNSLYEVQSFLKKLDLGYINIHTCKNDCCLFREENENLERCPQCDSSRWKKDERTKQIKKGIPAKVLRYFPIIPRLKRMFNISEVSNNLRWHSNHHSVDGKMRHPVDSVAWKTIDSKWPDFAMDPRNLRFGLSTDGFNPFSNLSSRYSCWPVMLVAYNLSPWLCMKKENIMLTLLIPGPKQPGNDIDIYLKPLIDDLKELWNGVQAFDIVTKTNFNLRAILMWTISDFPAFANLAGCTTKGKKACPTCGDHTNHVWLKHSKKTVYLGHRRFLPPTHSYRMKKSWFNGKKDIRLPPKIMNGNQIYTYLATYENYWGKDNKKRKRNKESIGRWKKRSIFFDLPYWKGLILRHNLDVMHIEKNVCESIVGTLLNDNKSKDGVNARKDLVFMGFRKELHPQEIGNKTYLPPAPHTMSKDEKQTFCKRLFNLKLPDGYSSNISNCISLDECKIIGLKSHDCHVLMQQLLPVALRGLLPKGPRNVIIRLCSVFNRLCQRAIDRDKLEEIEKEAVEIVCLLERFFPPSFFDIMIHLVIHLGREARLCGPVQFRWMYPFKRYMKILKGYVRNRARPEGCIAESYLADECVNFCSNFCKGSLGIFYKDVRNEEFNNDVILEGRPMSAGIPIILDDVDLENAHRYVLFNTAEVEPFVEMHHKELLDSNRRLQKDNGLLWKTHSEQFPTWLKSMVELNSSVTTYSTLLKWLANGPRKSAMSYTGYIINGQRFHINSVQRSTQNSGVYMDADTLCRSSSKDDTQVVDVVSYYGVVTEIILLDYYVHQLPVFRCNWVNVQNGIKVDDGFTLVNLHQSQHQFVKDPFILASQAKRVFYSREYDTSNWYVVLKAPTRGFNESEMYDGDVDTLVVNDGHSSINSSIEEDDEECNYARDDCEGLLID